MQCKFDTNGNKITLKLKIERKRKQMIKEAAYYGLAHTKTVNTSQQLDVLLNEYGKSDYRATR